jgi:polyferredoxin
VFSIQIPITFVLLLSIPLGAIFGKTFCRWMCPIGFFAEQIFQIGDKDLARQKMYNYHKLGCPIAWIQGFLNKYSFYKIKNDKNLCLDCGKCDNTCYITNLDKEYSFYLEGKKDPATSYKCSKCFECVAECPVNSLKLKAR